MKREPVTWHDDRTLTDTPDRGEWRCPYCGEGMPDGVPHPSVWQHCGEVGHAEHYEVDRRGKWVKSDHDNRD